MVGSTKAKPKSKPNPKKRTASEKGQTRRDKNRRVRREELRLYLSKQGLVPKVIRIAKKLGDMRNNIDPADVYRLKTAAELNLKLINKYLGDDKTLELTNDPDNPLVIQPIQYAEKKS